MGGLIALQLSTMKDVNVRHIVMIESFITSPGKFFQNILMESTNTDIKERILNMLKEESIYYSPQLKDKLRDLDLADLINKSNSNIHCIYGDRGINDRDKVISELELSDNIKKCININIIKNSCHFPMLENCGELLGLLTSIIKSNS